MNGFDQAIFDAMGRLAGRYPAIDLAIGHWVLDELIGKGDIVLGIAWGAWFLPGEPKRQRHEILATTAIAGAVAVLAGRGIGMAFPFRVRPIHDPSLHVHLAYGAKDAALRLWSSFPSDHAMVWAAIATGVARVSPLWGAIAGTVALVLVCLPRVYLGLHYPSDIVGGGVIGAVIAWALTHAAIRGRIAGPLLKIEARWPHLFYAGALVATMHLADMFVQLRSLLRLIRGLLG